MKPPDECMRKVSDAILRKSCPTQNALYRRGRLVSSLKPMGFSVALQPERFLERRNTTAGNRDLLFNPIEREQQRAA